VHGPAFGIRGIACKQHPRRANIRAQENGKCPRWCWHRRKRAVSPILTGQALRNAGHRQCTFGHHNARNDLLCFWSAHIEHHANYTACCAQSDAYIPKPCLQEIHLQPALCPCPHALLWLWGCCTHRVRTMRSPCECSRPCMRGARQEGMHILCSFLMLCCLVGPGHGPFR